MEGNSLTTMLSIRFLTGFFLAGIYRVGMKIAMTTLTKDLVNRWDFSGRLSIGTAFPHLLKRITGAFHGSVILTTSSLALLGGLMIVS
jgi:hypothetical protein